MTGGLFFALYGSTLPSLDIFKQKKPALVTIGESPLKEVNAKIQSSQASSYKIEVQYDKSNQKISIVKVEAISERISTDTRFSGDSPYQILITDSSNQQLFKAKETIIQGIYYDPGPNTKFSESSARPKKYSTIIYSPYFPDAKKISILKNGKSIATNIVPDKQRNLAQNVTFRTAEAGKVTIAIIGEGFSGQDFQSEAQSFISSIANVDPYGNTATLFNFVPYSNASPSGCTASIINCIQTVSMQSAMQQAMGATGAKGVVVLVNGGGVSATITGLPGPSVINVNPASNLGWLGTHEFLGHMIAKLNDRYYDQAIGGAGGIGLTPSNCSRSAGGESWWPQAGSTGVYPGCETPDTYAPFPNTCGAGKGNADSIMSGNCNHSGQFDSVEKYWITHNILPSLGTGGGQPTPTSPPATTNPAGFSAMPVICTNGTWYVHFYWDMTKLGLPAGATPEQLYVDLKTNDQDWGTNNFYSNGPLASDATNLDWGGIAPGENDLWRVNALYQGQWYGYQNVATLKTPACPDGAPGMTTSFISCNADSWKMNFYWPVAQVPSGQPQQVYVDLKFDDGTPFWNPDGSSNFVSNGPLSGDSTTVVWDGIKGGQKQRWHVNTSYTDSNGQTQWTGYQNEATFTTPVCPDSGGTWTGGGVPLPGGGSPSPSVSPPPGSGALKISAHLDKASYNQGESGQFCYSVAPQIAFHAKFYQSSDNTNFQKLLEWDDDGKDYCIPLSISPNAKIGPWQLKLEAYVNNSLADSITLSATINAAGTPTQPPSTTLTPTATPSPTPAAPPGATATPTTTPQPTATPTSIPGATATPTPIAATPTSIPGSINCGTDTIGDNAPAVHTGLMCLANAAQTCQAAQLTLNGTINLFGVTASSSTYYQIKGLSSNKCQLYLKQGVTSLTFPPGTPQDIIDQANASVKKFDNTDGNCLFMNNSDLAAIFTNWANGHFSTNDFSTGQCSGTYFDALNGGGPTPTPNPSQALLSVVVDLKPAVGSNTSRGENANPVLTARNGEVKVTNTSNAQVVFDQNIQFNFKNDNTFNANAGSFAPGTYDVKVRFDNTLWKDLGVVTLTLGTTASPKQASLRLGDINQDNVLDLADYNAFISCYGLGVCGQKTQTDLNLDGKVDEKDLNIFYSNLSNRQGD